MEIMYQTTSTWHFPHTTIRPKSWDRTGRSKKKKIIRRKRMFNQVINS